MNGRNRQTKNFYQGNIILQHALVKSDLKAHVELHDITFFASLIVELSQKEKLQTDNTYLQIKREETPFHVFKIGAIVSFRKQSGEPTLKTSSHHECHVENEVFCIF